MTRPPLALSLVHPSTSQRINCPALLVRAALAPREQLALYKQLCWRVADSYEWGALLDDAPTERPQPLCVWNHPYTGNSNTRDEPGGLFSWAHSLAERAATQVSAEGTEGTSEIGELCGLLGGARFDSLVSLLYDARGILQPHVDDGLPGIGLSLSLGAPCTFVYGGTKVTLTSGDALFGAYGHVTHQVLSIHSLEGAPEWWRALPTRPGGSGGMPPSFGRVRCNLQLRHGRDEEARAMRREAALAARPAKATSVESSVDGV